MLSKSGLISSSSPQRSSSESMLDRLCNDDDNLLNDSHGNLDDVFNDSAAAAAAAGIDGRLSRTQSCASLVNGEGDAASSSNSPLKSRWSQSSPSLLTKGEIERLALEAARSQDLGFLKSSVETLKEQLGR